MPSVGPPTHCYGPLRIPTWRLAQPFREIAHKGEVNTVRGNMNWMSCHEDRMDSDVFGDNVEDIKPVIAKGSSDSAALDSVFELLLQAGRDLPMVKTMMIPQAVTPDVPSELAGLYGYCNAVMEPWDGPAAIAGVGFIRSPLVARQSAPPSRIPRVIVLFPSSPASSVARCGICRISIGAGI